MGRRTKKSLIIITVVCFVAWATFDRSLLQQLVAASLSEILSSSSVTAEVEQASAHWLGISTGPILLHGRSPFAAVTLDGATADCKPLSVLMGNPACTSQLSLYGGSGAFSYTKQAGTMLLTGDLDKLDLKRHKLIKSYGIERGNLSVRALKIEARDNIIQTASARIEIADLNKPAASRLAPSLTGLPLTLEVPALEIATAHLIASMTPQTLELHDIAMSSSLGELEGTISLAARVITGAHLVLSLNAQGKETLSPYLVFVCPKSALEPSQPEPLRFDFKDGQIRCTVAS
jgi:hypothetical protein